MEKNVFSKSETFKSEYSCAIVRVPELTPIEGSDFLAKTNIFGTQIVVRKDQVAEGDIMIYAANETQLNERFLSVNNLFEISCRDKNANAQEVAAIMSEYEPIKADADKKRSEAKVAKNAMESLTKKSQKLQKEIKKKQKAAEKIEKDSEEYNIVLQDVPELQKKADEYIARAMSYTTQYTNLKKEVEDIVKSGEHIVAEAKKHCGFFNKYGRVRCLTLKGCPSFGVLFSPADLIKFDPSVTLEDITEYVGQEFDTVNGELFVKVYIPPVKERPERGSRMNKAQKKISRFDRMIEGEFTFHYETSQLPKVIETFKPEDIVDISVKRHGCVERSTIIDTKEYGKKTIGEIVDNALNCHIKAYDTDAETIVYVPIDKFYTIPNDGEWYEIELENGKKITITGNNPVWLPELGAYRRVDELNGDEFLLVSED